MGRFSKLRQKILSASSDANIGFSDLCQLLVHFGFEERIRGDHHIFTKSGVEEIINIQPIGAKAKPYQVRQVRSLIIKYHLGEQDVD
jgi:HicA-like toxin of HicAB toxin-antitoxin system